MSDKLTDSTRMKMLEVIAAADRMTLCSAEPANYADATQQPPSGYRLAAQNLVPGIGQGKSFSVTTQGGNMILTMKNFSGIAVDVAGTITHVAIVKTTTQDLIAALEVLQPVSVTPSDTINTTEWIVTLGNLE